MPAFYQPNSDIDLSSKLSGNSPSSSGFQTFSLENGKELKYFAVEPKEIDKSKVLISFPPGDQTAESVYYSLTPFLSELKEKGWLVLSPVAPEGTLFFSGAEKEMQMFIDESVKKYDLGNAKLHVMGGSHGGISAFHAAVSNPNLFQSLTVFPGFPNRADEKKLAKIKDMKVNFITGEYDFSFLDRARKSHGKLRGKDGSNVTFNILKDAGHSLYNALSFKDLEPLISTAKSS